MHQMVVQEPRQEELKKERKLFQQHKYSAVIAQLEPKIMYFRESFEFFYMLGVSCLYTGDIGGAQDYLTRAATLKSDAPSLLTAQAAMFLRRGDTAQAVDTYLEVLEYEPQNKVAKRAMTFIRKNGDISTISQWVSNGKIKKFYPDTGFYFPVMPVVCTFGIALLIVASVFLGRFISKTKPQRADLSHLELSSEEKRNPIDVKGGIHNLILTSSEITSSHDKAIDYFQKHRDNAAIVEINRVLNSNASSAIKAKMLDLYAFMKDPDFETVKNNAQDNYSYNLVSQTPYLYQNCWVVWSGRVANVVEDEYQYMCDFVIGYETMVRIDGIVSLVVDKPTHIDPERPLQILGRIDFVGTKIILHGKTVYQPIQGELK